MNPQILSPPLCFTSRHACSWASWAYALEKIPIGIPIYIRRGILGRSRAEFLVKKQWKSQRSRDQPSDRRTRDPPRDWRARDPQGIEVQETPQQSLGETLTNNEGYHDPILDFLNDSNLDFLNDPDLDFLFDPNFPF